MGNFLLLKLTHLNQEKAGAREGPDKDESFLMPQDLRSQPQKDGSLAFATNTRTCTWRVKAVVRNTTKLLTAGILVLGS